MVFAIRRKTPFDEDSASGGEEPDIKIAVGDGGVPLDAISGELCTHGGGFQGHLSGGDFSRRHAIHARGGGDKARLCPGVSITQNAEIRNALRELDISILLFRGKPLAVSVLRDSGEPGDGSHRGLLQTARSAPCGAIVLGNPPVDISLLEGLVPLVGIAVGHRAKCVTEREAICPAGPRGNAQGKHAVCNRGCRFLATLQSRDGSHGEKAGVTLCTSVALFAGETL